MRLSLVAAILSSAMLVCCQESGDPNPLPRRPERFGNTDQISNYLKELQDYYAVHGRGRYGKRQMRTIMSDSSIYVRDIPPPPHVYFRNLEYLHRDLQQDKLTFN